MAEQLLPYIIGVSGGTASGKTTFVDALMAMIGSRCSVLPMDSYYHDISKAPVTAEGRLNFDSIDSVDVELYVKHLRELAGGTTIRMPQYDFATHHRSTAVVAVEPRPILIAEGIMLLALPEIRALLDFSVYVRLESDLRLIRRLKRDTNERGRTIDSVLDQWVSTVQPFHDASIEPSASHADLIVNTQNFDRLESAIRKLVAIMASI